MESSDLEIQIVAQKIVISLLIQYYPQPYEHPIHC